MCGFGVEEPCLFGFALLEECEKVCVLGFRIWEVVVAAGAT